MGLTHHPKCTQIFPPRDDELYRSSPGDLATNWDDLEALEDDKLTLQFRREGLCCDL